MALLSFESLIPIMKSKGPRRKIDFVDLGTGDGLRAAMVGSKRKKRRVEAVDQSGKALRSAFGDAKPKDLGFKFYEKDVKQYLKHKRNNSIRVANADYLINNLTHEGEAEEFLTVLHRKMIPRGRVYLTVPENYEMVAHSQLTRNGFSIEGKLVGEEIPLPGVEAHGIPNIIGQNVSTAKSILNPTDHQKARGRPVRFLAVKKS